MEDAVSVVPSFVSSTCFHMGGRIAPSSASSLKFSPLPFFTVFDGYGGPQASGINQSRFQFMVADFCAERVHQVIAEELNREGIDGSEWKKKWKGVFSSGFRRADYEGAWHPYLVSIYRSFSSLPCDRYMSPYTIPVPEITFMTRSEEDECLILASDGLWGVMSNDEVGEVAHPAYKANQQIMVSGDVSPAKAVAGNLMKPAISKNSSDNISIIVVLLRLRHPAWSAVITTLWSGISKAEMTMERTRLMMLCNVIKSWLQWKAEDVAWLRAQFM
ncbi:Protein phosphatase 2C 16 [Bienertia sinuspersici]